MSGEPETTVVFTEEDVEAGVQSLIANEFVDLDREDMEEIVQLVLTYATKGLRQWVYRCAREDAARDIARANANFTASPDMTFTLKFDGRQYLSRAMAVQIARGQQPAGEQR